MQMYSSCHLASMCNPNIQTSSHSKRSEIFSEETDLILHWVLSDSAGVSLRSTFGSFCVVEFISEAQQQNSPVLGIAGPGSSCHILAGGCPIHPVSCYEFTHGPITWSFDRCYKCAPLRASQCSQFITAQVLTLFPGGLACRKCHST